MISTYVNPLTGGEPWLEIGPGMGLESGKK